MAPQRITVLGSTGSIGVNTLDVLRRHPDRYAIFALTAHSQSELLFKQCLEFKPCFAVIGDAAAANQLGAKLRQAGSITEVLSNNEDWEWAVSAKMA